MNTLWVKQSFSDKAWDTISQDTSYCYLFRDPIGKRIWAGFCIADTGNLPDYCEQLTPDEMVKVNESRKNANIAPLGCFG